MSDPSTPTYPSYEALPARFSMRTRLSVAPSQLWAACVRMSGVNAELGPWVRMTAPAEARALSLADARLHEPLFTSVLLLLGVLPIDLHFLRMAEITPGERFVEQSSSLLNVAWRHERSVTPGDAAGTCELTDRIAYRSRLPGIDRAMLPIVRAVFTHRHRRLRSRYGAA